MFENCLQRNFLKENYFNILNRNYYLRRHSNIVIDSIANMSKLFSSVNNADHVSVNPIWNNVKFTIYGPEMGRCRQQGWQDL